MREAKIPFPRFYFKKVGGSISIEHRLTHSYMTAVKDEEELATYLKEMNKLSPEDFWLMMIAKNVRIPDKQPARYGSGNREKDDSEEWFYNAWSIYTDEFYQKNPKLLVVEEELPFDVIKKIRREQYQKHKEETQQYEHERRQAEEKLREQERQERIRQREELKPKEIVEGKIGSGVGLDKLKRTAKKGLKKLKIKTKQVTIDIEDSIDPFA